MKLKELQRHIDALKKQEAVAETKEQLLNEEKEHILLEVNSLLEEVQQLDIVPSGTIAVNNLSRLVDQIEAYIDKEVSKSTIPPELL